MVYCGSLRLTLLITHTDAHRTAQTPLLQATAHTIMPASPRHPCTQPSVPSGPCKPHWAAQTPALQWRFKRRAVKLYFRSSAPKSSTSHNITAAMMTQGAWR